MAYIQDPATGRLIFTQDPSGTSVQRPGGSFQPTSAPQGSRLVRDPNTGRITLGTTQPTAPVQQSQPQQPQQPQQSFMGRLARTGGNIAKELILSPFRLLASPFAILSEELPALARGQAPKSTALSRFAFRNTEPETYQRAGAAAERAFDAASLLVGGGAIGAATKQAAGQGAKGFATQLGKQAIRTAPADIALGAGFGASAGVQEGRRGRELLAPTALGAGIGFAAPLAFGLGAKGVGSLMRGAGRAVERKAPGAFTRMQPQQAAQGELPITTKEIETRLSRPTPAPVEPGSLLRSPRTKAPTPLVPGSTQRSLEEVEAEINKQVEKYRREAGYMAEREGAGVVERPVYDAAGNVNFVAKDFKKTRAMASMRRQKRSYVDQAKKDLYEYDPEFRKLVDEAESLKAGDITAGPDYRTVDEIMAGVTKAEKQAAVRAGESVAGKATAPISMPKRVEGLNIEKYKMTPEQAEKAVMLERYVNEQNPELKRVIKDKTLDKMMADADEIPMLSRDEMTQQIASVDKLRDTYNQLLNSTDGLSAELMQIRQVVKSYEKLYGTALRRSGIVGDRASAKAQVLNKLSDLDDKWDEIITASKKVDFNNPKEVTKFYRTFVKPSMGDVVDELRYINLLSSFKTHNINAFSNLLQAGFTAPVTKLTTGAIDFVASAMTGRQRKAYMSEVPAYYRGMLNSVGDAAKDALAVFRGEKFVQRPDVNFLPTGSKYTNWGMFIPRALEAGDIFFRTLVRSGEEESLMLRAVKKGVVPNMDEISKEAERKAKYYIFRGDVDPSGKLTGQGHLLRNIDKATEAIYKLREFPMVKWVIPFVQTPMNILKQGIEYSPAGFATIMGAKDKQEQLAKAIIGSFVMAGAASVIASTDSTWSVPSNKKERDAFYASGRKPYSIKIGDTWVSYSKLGPLAYPIALASAVKYYTTQDPDRFDKSAVEKITDTLGATLHFYSDQSYLQGIQQMIDLATGEPWEKKQAAIGFSANFGRQLIPLSSLQGYVARIIDPVYREAKTVPEKVMSGIPGLSTYLEPYTTPSGEVERRTNPLLNALTPFGFQQANPEYETEYQQSQGARSFLDRLQSEGQPIQPTINQYRVSDPDFFRSLQKEQTYQRFDLTEDERELIGMGVENGERARAIYGLWVNMPQEQRGALLNRLRATGIITKEVMQKLAPLLTQTPL